MEILDMIKEFFVKLEDKIENKWHNYQGKKLSHQIQVEIVELEK